MNDNSYGVSTARVEAWARGTIAIDGRWQTDFIAEGIEPFWTDADDADDVWIPAHAAA